MENHIFTAMFYDPHSFLLISEMEASEGESKEPKETTDNLEREDTKIAVVV